MTRTMYILCAVQACLPTAMPAGAAEPDADSVAAGRYVHQIAADVVPGAILHTNEFLRGGNPEMRTMNHNTGIRLKYAFAHPEASREAHVYRDAYQGVGIAYNSFNPQLGNPVSVFLLQGARIASLSDKASLNYEWNFGLAMGWNPYDEERNPYNKVIGSRVTAYMGVDMYVRWILSRHADINIGLCAAYYFNRRATHLLYRHERLPKVSHTVTCDVILYGAWRQRGTYYVGEAYALPGKSAVYGFNINPMYRLNHWLKAGASLDGTYDRCANLIDLPTDGTDPDPYMLPSAAKQMALGVSARAEFTMPYFAINIGVGTNVLNGSDDFGGVYETLALKVALTRRALLHIGYCLNDFHVPKHLMLGVGWRFGRL